MRNTRPQDATDGSDRQAGFAAILADRPRTGFMVQFLWGLFFAALLWSWHDTGFSVVELVSNSGNIWELLVDFFPPDFSRLGYFVHEMLITIEIALAATFLSVISAVPLALLSSKNIVSSKLRFPVRRSMDGLRAINELVLAMIFVVAVGLGPPAGILAIFVHTTAVLAKLFSEVVETVDQAPIEGIRATGANRLEEIVYGVIPQVMPLWVSITLYRFETNVRSATVIGLVGAGGIGLLLWEYIRGFEFQKTSAVLIVIVVAVMIIDMISSQLRKYYV